jgi:hypothetical protein
MIKSVSDNFILCEGIILTNPSVIMSQKIREWRPKMCFGIFPENLVLEDALFLCTIGNDDTSRLVGAVLWQVLTVRGGGCIGQGWGAAVSLV